MQLSENDLKRLQKYYQESLKEHGPHNPMSVRWLDQHNQLVRFNTLCKIGSLEHKRILDLGCGLGDLYDFLRHNVKRFQYLGIDLVPEMIAAAKQKYPAANFALADVFKLEQKFDYVLASGAMTFRFSAGKQFYYDMIAKLFALAEKGVAFNMLDRTYFYDDDKYLVYDPQEIADQCEKLTKKYKIIMGYLEGDFTVYLLK